MLPPHLAIDPNSAVPPKNWQGWPEGKQFALVLSHDVDTQKVHDDIPKLMDLEEKMGAPSKLGASCEVRVLTG